MNHPDSSSKVASPLSTGGVGSHFEARVGACYLVSILVDACPRGYDNGVIRDVRAQRRFEGQPLDDLVVRVDRPGDIANLTIQIKRDLTFGDADETFDGVMRDAWNTFTAQGFRQDIDRLGIVLGLYSKKIDEHYRTALAWARNSASATDFMKRIATPRLSSQTQRSFVQLIRTKLDKHAAKATSDEEVWRFLRSFQIIHFDVTDTGDRDQVFAVEQLKRILLPSDQHRAHDLFNELIDISAIGNWTAGSFDAHSLRAELVSRGWNLGTPISCQDDLRRLDEHAGYIMAGIRSDIDGVQVPRESFFTDVGERIDAGRFVELAGPAGSGKSAALKSLATKQANDEPTLIFSGERINGSGWNEVASQLGLKNSLRDILFAASTQSEPRLFIDGIDKVVASGPRMAVNDLVRATASIAEETQGAIKWTIVASLREDSIQEVHGWLDLHATGPPIPIAVPDFTDEDLDVLCQSSIKVSELRSLRQLDEIIRKPFFLNVLIDSRMQLASETGEEPVTEVRVADIWWQRVVGADGPRGRARQQALVQLGQRDVPFPGKALDANELDAESLYSLEVDGIIRREVDRDLYRFRHDLLEDWTLSRVLNQRRETLPQLLLDLAQPLGLLRPVQLLGTVLLERDDVEGEWERLIREFENTTELSPRWRQYFLASPLKSPIGRKLLAKVEPLLLENEGERLRDLVVTARTVEVNPNPSWLPVAEKVGQSEGEIAEMLLRNPIPRWREWLPLIDRLVFLADRIPYQVRPDVAKLFEIWQRATKEDMPYRRSIAELSLAWLRQEED